MSVYDEDYEDGEFIEADYRKISSDDISEDFFICRHFLDTSKQFSHVSDWIMQLDEDTKDYIIQTSTKLMCDEDEDDEKFKSEYDEEEEESDPDCEDIVMFGVLAMSKEFPDFEMDDEDLAKCLNCIVEFTAISKGVKRGNIEIVNWGTKSIFDESMEFRIIEKKKNRKNS